MKYFFRFKGTLFNDDNNSNLSVFKSTNIKKEDKEKKIKIDNE